MALPVAAIIAIVFGVWALLVLLIFALYQILKVRILKLLHCNGPKFLNKPVWANYVDPV